MKELVSTALDKASTSPPTLSHSRTSFVFTSSRCSPEETAPPGRASLTPHQQQQHALGAVNCSSPFHLRGFISLPPDQQTTPQNFMQPHELLPLMSKPLLLPARRSSANRISKAASYPPSLAQTHSSHTLSSFASSSLSTPGTSSDCLSQNRRQTDLDLSFTQLCSFSGTLGRPRSYTDSLEFLYADNKRQKRRRRRFSEGSLSDSEEPTLSKHSDVTK